MAEATKLTRVRWRTDVIISSSSVSKVLRTALTMELTLDTGRVVTMEVPAERLAELRYTVAKALFEVGGVEAHPVLRIV
jgi:hypothetical protein